MLSRNPSALVRRTFPALVFLALVVTTFTYSVDDVYSKLSSKTIALSFVILIAIVGYRLRFIIAHCLFVLTWFFFSPSRLTVGERIYDLYLRIPRIQIPCFDPSQVRHASPWWMRSWTIILKVLLSVCLATISALFSGFVFWFPTCVALILAFEILHTVWVLFLVFCLGRTQLISLFGEDVSGFRQVFQRTQVTYGNVPTSHSHGKCAQVRSAGYDAIRKMALVSGREIYSISKSEKDRREGYRGNRYFYFSKDTTMDYARDPAEPNDLVQLIDVDYYVDMPSVLAGQRDTIEPGSWRSMVANFLTPAEPVPVVCHSFNPKKATGSGPGYNWRVLDGKIQMAVAGGALYEHALWDYSRDTATVWSNGSLFSYHVDTRPYDEDPNFSLVSLSPARLYHLHWVPFYLRWYLIGDLVAPLKRLDLSLRNVDSGIGRGYITKRYLSEHNGKTVPFVSGAINGVSAGFAVPEEALTALYLRLYRLLKPGSSPIGLLQPADVERLFNAENLVPADFPKSSIITLIDFVERTPFHIPEALNSGGATNPRRDEHTYTCLGSSVFELGKPAMRAIGAPFGGKAFAPGRCLNNDEATIQGRILGVQQREPLKQDAKHFKWTHDYVYAFRRLMLGSSAGHLVPYEYEDVISQQTRPTQRARQVQGFGFLDVAKRVVSSFMKAESYSKVSDPRNISTVSEQHLNRLSSFTYSFYANVLKHQTWYAFGKTPLEISQTIAELLGTASKVESGDITRLDGSFPAELGKVVSAIFLGAFHPRYRQELLDLLDSEVDIPAFTKFGAFYLTGSTTLSGSPITAMRNSVGMAYVLFCLLCDLRAGHDDKYEWAFKRIGQVGGDDTLNTHLDATELVTGFGWWNLQYKPCTILRGNPVKYLGRVFLTPWFGGLQCIADVPRLMRKVHLTASKDTPDAVVAHQKATSYNITDPNTPIVGVWAKKVLSFTATHPDVLGMTGKMYQDTDTSYWVASTPCLAHMFVTPELDSPVAYEAASQDMGLDPADIRAIEARIKGCASLEELLSLENQFDEKFEVTVAAVVGGEVVGPPPREPLDPLPANPSNKPSTDPIVRETVQAPAKPVPARNRAAERKRKELKVRGTAPLPRPKRQSKL